MSLDSPKIQNWPAAAVGSMPRAELHGFDDQQPQLLAGTDRAAGGCDQAMGLKVLAPPSLGIEGWRIYALEALRGSRNSDIHASRRNFDDRLTAARHNFAVRRRCKYSRAIVRFFVTPVRIAAVRCDDHERPGCGVVSTGGRNTLIFYQRWSVEHEVSSSHLLFGFAAG